ncbi:MAG: tRNA pseudouridine synthase A [Ignavibacteria bacterium]|nr:tRNA pseudouridine synthase A [Ignavibacteria bacterium]
MKLKFLIEYDGTGYSGWQIQKNAKSIQGTIIKSIEKVFSESKGNNVIKDFQGSGRTDSGVHAHEQAAHLECETTIPPHVLKILLNNELPSSIAILDIEKADDRFHARHSAKARQYVYRISKRKSALGKKYVWWVKDKLDVEKMKKITNLFIGIRDYKSFTEKIKEEKSTKVYVEELDLSEETDLILIRIKASHFLWKMVRRITGVLVEAGRGNIGEKEIKSLFKNYSDLPAKLTAPPSGLFLEKIFY